MFANNRTRKKICFALFVLFDLFAFFACLFCLVCLFYLDCLCCLHLQSQLRLSRCPVIPCFEQKSEDADMFGALNRFIGRLDSEPLRHSREDSDDVSFGFQVLRNKNPDLPLEPWFDFIVGINGHAIVRCYYSSMWAVEITDMCVGRWRASFVFNRSAQLRGGKRNATDLECQGWSTTLLIMLSRQAYI